MNRLNLSDLRRNYEGTGLDEQNLLRDPIELLRLWVKEAVDAGVRDANAMALSTVDKKGIPDVRVVLLKEVSEAGVTFFTNYNSEKGRQLADNPVASCCIWWSEFERQIRFTGKVEKVDDSVSDEYFATRPRESQISAWASRQSSVVKDREDLERLYREFEKKFDGQPVPRPEVWGGYEINVSDIEFWQGRPGRLHDRILYCKDAGTWNVTRLAP